MQNKRSNKLKLAVVGPASSKLYASLMLAHGICGNWNRIIVVGSSSRSYRRYQLLGNYNTLEIAADATPQRYSELLNICCSCKDLVIFSNLSDEYRYGVSQHLNSSVFEDLLRAHRTFLNMLRTAPVHIISCIDTRKVFLQKDEVGKRRLSSEQVIQQPGIENHFTTVLRLDKHGKAQVIKDTTHVFETGQAFHPTLHHGALLHDWCRSGEPVIAPELQQRIDSCRTLAELYQLLFETDTDDLNIMSAFTRRRLELDEEYKAPQLDVIRGGVSL